ncbi:hypothetical protein BT93_G0100 [Corymbia citriodora subsp. variegata]|nr:hypothetical protein BT93_G0100 [Corymbia citriodora subsp. variegata]
MVSHDEHLIVESVDELWVVSQGKAMPFHGNFQDHKKILYGSKGLEYFTKHITRLSYREKAKKDKEMIVADIQDVLTVIEANPFFA